MNDERVSLTNKFSITRLRFAATPQSQLQTIQQLSTAARAGMSGLDISNGVL
jgi:hypothetical protein